MQFLSSRQLGSLPEGRFPHSVGEMSAKQTKGVGRVTLDFAKQKTEGVANLPAAETANAGGIRLFKKLESW